MKSNIKEALDELEKTDIYSIILFTIWKLKEVEEFSTLSELSYIMDNDSLIRFLKYYGGKTITIPTFEDFKNMFDALVLYSEVNLEGREYSEVINELPKDSLNDIKECYLKICDVLKNYDFRRN